MKDPRIKCKKVGYTFFEIVTVMVLVAVLGSLALARIPVVMYRIRNQEAMQLLLAIYTSQIDYEKDTGSFTNDINDLDIAIDPTEIKNFNTLTVNNLSNVTCPPNAARQYLASLTADMGGYVLYILDDGQIVCTPCASPGPGGVCEKMGFPTF